MLYVVWHPENEQGAKLAARILSHFGTNRYQNITGGSGVRVIFRNAVAPGTDAPLPINWGDADTVAVVLLADSVLANDPKWTEYVRELAEQANAKGLNTRVFPVTIDAEALNIGFEEQALRWDRFTGEDIECEQWLIRELTYEFSRMLRYHLTQLRHPNEGEERLGCYLRKVEVFLSHSKHDAHGKLVAKGIRDWLHENSALSSFIDLHDIPAGLSFSSVIIHSIQGCVMMAIYSDSYSSREWCRREVIEAKRRNVPMLVVDCLETIDESAFPYLGNVPIIRMSPDQMERIDQIAGCLLDEVFKDFLWKCRVEKLRLFHPQVFFVARSPELISLVNLPIRTNNTERSIVYPDPPLSTEEARLFADIVNDVRLQSLTEWLVEN